MHQLEHLFQALTEAGLVINLQKSDFGQSYIDYIGHKIGRGIVRPKEARAVAIKEFPRPIGKREVMRYLGWPSFFSRFCPLQHCYCIADGFTRRTDHSHGLKNVGIVLIT